MEIEKKFLLKQLPTNLEKYESHRIEQAYLCTEPVLRIRKFDAQYFITYKGKGLMVREEHELPLTEEAYLHLKKKADGNVIEKTRYLIPDEHGHTIELDVFDGDYSGLLMAEVEFSSTEAADGYKMPDWFSKEVTADARFQNSRLSEMSDSERDKFLKEVLA